MKKIKEEAMAKIEKLENCYTLMVGNNEIGLIMKLPLYWQTDETSMKEEKWNRPVRMLEEVWELIEGKYIKYEAGCLIEKKIDKNLTFNTKFTGGILFESKFKNVLQFIPLYREEIAFARRMGWRKLKNMFKYLTPEELYIVSEERYNIITDVDGRRNCF